MMTNYTKQDGDDNPTVKIITTVGAVAAAGFSGLWLLIAQPQINFQQQATKDLADRIDDMNANIVENTRALDRLTLLLERNNEPNSKR